MMLLFILEGSSLLSTPYGKAIVSLQRVQVLQDTSTGRAGISPGTVVAYRMISVSRSQHCPSTNVSHLDDIYLCLSFPQRGLNH